MAGGINECDDISWLLLIVGSDVATSDCGWLADRTFEACDFSSAS